MSNEQVEKELHLDVQDVLEARRIYPILCQSFALMFPLRDTGGEIGRNAVRGMIGDLRVLKVIASVVLPIEAAREK